MDTCLTLSSLMPAVTVFSFRVTLGQTHSIISPRDDLATAKPVVSIRYFIVVDEGKRPPKEHQHPNKHLPALWRGSEAGGKDDGELKIETRGRLTNDDHGRPSTLPGWVSSWEKWKDF